MRLNINEETFFQECSEFVANLEELFFLPHNDPSSKLFLQPHKVCLYCERVNGMRQNFRTITKEMLFSTPSFLDR